MEFRWGKSSGVDEFECLEHLFEFFNEFFTRGHLLKAISSYLLALIPKNYNLQELNAFRPICLIGSVYKIILKFLVGRLNTVIGKLIYKSQTVFIKNINMFDIVLLVKKLVNYARKNKKDMFIFKVDFKKAFDSVSQDYDIYSQAH